MKYDKAVITRLHEAGAHFVRLDGKVPQVPDWQHKPEPLESLLTHNDHIGVMPASLGLCVVDVDKGNESDAACKKVVNGVGEPLARHSSSVLPDGMHKVHMLYKEPSTSISAKKFKYGEVIHGGTKGAQVRIPYGCEGSWSTAVEDSWATDNLKITALPSDDPREESAQWAEGNRHNTLVSKAAKIALRGGDGMPAALEKLRRRAITAGLEGEEVDRVVRDAIKWAEPRREDFDAKNPLIAITHLGMLVRKHHMYDGRWYDLEPEGLWREADGLNSRRRRFTRALCIETLKMKSLSAASGVIREMETELRAPELDWFDRSPLVCGLPEGDVLYLDSGDSFPADGSEYVSKRLGVEPSAKSNPPKWLSFLDDILPDKECIRWFQRWLGYCLTADIREEKFVFLHGSGRNGKTTLINVIKDIFSEYHKELNQRGLVGRKEEHPQWIAQLKGVRCATLNELPTEGRWNIDVIKDLTGGGEVTARLMRENEFSFAATCKLIVAGNSKPEIEHIDEALRRRMIIIPLKRVPKQSEDLMLKNKLRSEYPRILSWMIEGCLEWQDRGLGEPPQAILAETKVYFTEEDSHAGWISMFTSGTEDFVSNDQIRRSYETAMGVSVGKTGRMGPLIDLLVDRFPYIKRHKRGGLRGVLGLSLQEVELAKNEFEI